MLIAFINFNLEEFLKYINVLPLFFITQVHCLQIISMLCHLKFLDVYVQFAKMLKENKFNTVYFPHMG